jgi:hypothetical protein
MICSEAVIHPVRVPGAMTLEKVSIRMTLSNVGTKLCKKSSLLVGGGTSGAFAPVLGFICRK